eukprot:TRINITY_DN14776_c0_g2_i1.p1 TRINITY_DN14776_c0_g2~~TRINITY_DN14776_c0_g2_i1.p1  ORF type:complete len:399 (+),score=37.58 TRINITY_DN14776_c0_g2_i1:81-1199(+)
MPQTARICHAAILLLFLFSHCGICDTVADPPIDEGNSGVDLKTVVWCVGDGECVAKGDAGAKCVNKACNCSNGFVNSVDNGNGQGAPCVQEGIRSNSTDEYHFSVKFTDGNCDALLRSAGEVVGNAKRWFTVHFQTDLRNIRFECGSIIFYFSVSLTPEQLVDKTAHLNTFVSDSVASASLESVFGTAVDSTFTPSVLQCNPSASNISVLSPTGSCVVLSCNGEYLPSWSSSGAATCELQTQLSSSSDGLAASQTAGVILAGLFFCCCCLAGGVYFIMFKLDSGNDENQTHGKIEQRRESPLNPLPAIHEPYAQPFDDPHQQDSTPWSNQRNPSSPTHLPAKTQLPPPAYSTHDEAFSDSDVHTPTSRHRDL